MWARACTPVPITARSAAPGRASTSVASTDTAAVRISVIAEPFSSARGSPVWPSNIMTVPRWVSSPRSALAGLMVMALKP